MINISNGRYQDFVNADIPCQDAEEALALIFTHLAPLGKSRNRPDNHLYQDAKESLEYFANILNLKNVSRQVQ